MTEKTDPAEGRITTELRDAYKEKSTSLL